MYRHFLYGFVALVLVGGCTDDPASSVIFPPNNTNTGTNNNSVEPPNNTNQADMPADMTAQSCTTHQECEAPEVCVYDLETGLGECGTSGPGTTGDVCSTGAECQSGICLNGICADPCGTCPTGFVCETSQIPLSSGGTFDLDVCIPEPNPCLSDSNCANNTVCVVDRTDADDPLLCRAPVGDLDLGESCTMDSQCRSNLCVDGACTKPCERPNDCATDGSYLCRTTDISEGGAANEVAICVPRPEDECLSDSQCPTGRCIATKTSTAITFSCGAPNSGGGETGDTCAADSDCAQNLCLNGLCAAPCQAGGDCANAPDFSCQLSSIEVSAGTANASVCVPPVECENRDACRASETCFVRASNAGVDLFCRAPNAGGGNLGQVCTSNATCGANYCLETRFRDVCTNPCQTNADCPTAGYICGSVDVDFQGGQEAVSMCVPVAPTPCTSNTSCPSGQRCSIIENTANTGLEAVCVPVTGGLASGTACTQDNDCASLLCTNGFCSDVCTDANQCGNNQLCQDRTVVKGGLSGDFQICETLADQGCSDSSSCTDGVRVCSDIRLNASNTYETFCELPNNAAAGQLGDPCTTNSQCRENICLQGTYCSVICNDDTDCASGQGCTTFGYSSMGTVTQLGFCVDVCTDNTDCSNGNICTISPDTIANDVDLICEAPIGTKDLGDTCANGGECISGLCLTSFAYNNTQCTSDAQCAQDETCECPVDNPNCANADKRCATTELACTRICDGNEDCSGGVAGNELTECANDVVVQRPQGGTKRISTCSRAN